MNWFIFVLSVFACYRLSILISKESGPGKVSKKLRELPKPKSSWREGLSCPLCLSVWFSALITGYLWYIGMVEPKIVPLYWLAVSAGAVVLNQKYTKNL